MTRITAAVSDTFHSLRTRNYRLYFVGQIISASGTWMQSVALVWLVLQDMHGSPVEVGVVTALQFVPMLLAGSWGGVVVDRVPKRTLLFVTQSVFLVLALVLGILTVTGTIVLWQVYVLAFLIGIVNLFDNPARQSFVPEMVGLDLLPNAVSLNSVVMNSARVIGPAIAGALLVTAGTAACFFANAASFVAVIVALAMMRRSDLHREPLVERGKGQVREGLRYVWTTPSLRDVLIMLAVVGVFAFNFNVTLPLLAKFTFHGGAGTYSSFLGAMGFGAVLGGLSVARRKHSSATLLGMIGVVFGLLIGVVAVAPTALLATIALVPMGAASIAFVATANSTLQLQADPAIRGRVMALYSIAFLGSTPIGAPMLGAISGAGSPRMALGLGALATVAAAASVASGARRAARRSRGVGLVAVSEGELVPVAVSPAVGAPPGRPPVEDRDAQALSSAS